VNHSDVQRYMPDYLEGELALDRRALFDAHLDECADCAGEVAGFRATIAALRRLPEPETPTDLTTNVMRRIRLGEGRTSVLDRVRDFGSELFAPRILAPVSAALLAAGVILGTGDLRDHVETLRSGIVGASEPMVVSLRAPDPMRQRGFDVRTVNEPGASTGGPGMHMASTDGNFAAPRTQGQELIALSQLMDERTSIRTRFNDWPAVRPAPTVSVALNPVGPVVERSTSSLLTEPMIDPGQRWPSADEWLVHVQQKPSEFADLMALRTLAEQEHWVDRLAHRALERGELDEVVAALRASGNERARILADDFAAVGIPTSSARFTAPRRD